MMKNWVLLFVLLSAHKGAFCFIPVTDAAAAVHAAKAALQTAETIKNQMEQMDREIRWMIERTKSLKDIGFNDWNKIEKHLRFLDEFNRLTDSLTFGYKNISSNIDRLYKTSKEPFGNRYEKWQEQKYNSIKKAMVAHGVLENSKTQMGKVSSLIKSSRTSKNDKQVLETVAELNAIHAQQLDELKTIIATDSRAKQSALMEETSKEHAMRETDQQFMKGFGKKKKEKQLTRLPSLS